MRQVTADLNAIALAQVFLGDGPGGHPHGGLPRRGAAAAPVVPETVFLLVGVIGMAGAEAVHDLGIVLGALVGIVDHQADGGAGGLALEDAGEDLHLIGLAPLGGMA